MSEMLWLNVPLMVFFFVLTVAIPLWLLVRHREWQGKPEGRTFPAYLAARHATLARGLTRVPRAARRDSRLAVPPLSSGAHG